MAKQFDWFCHLHLARRRPRYEQILWAIGWPMATYILSSHLHGIPACICPPTFERTLRLRLLAGSRPRIPSHSTEWQGGKCKRTNLVPRPLLGTSCASACFATHYRWHQRTQHVTSRSNNKMDGWSSEVHRKSEAGRWPRAGPSSWQISPTKHRKSGRFPSSQAIFCS